MILINDSTETRGFGLYILSDGSRKATQKWAYTFPSARSAAFDDNGRSFTRAFGQLVDGGQKRPRPQRTETSVRSFPTFNRSFSDAIKGTRREH